MEPMRVAALSPDGKAGDKEHNLAAAARGIEAAADAGVELAVFSEWYLTHCVNDTCYRHAERVPDGPSVQRIIELAAAHGVTVAMGIEELDPDRGVVYNTHFLTGPNGYIGKHRKTHLMTGEMSFHRAGCELRVFELDKCTAGIEICHETMYPELSRVQTLKGMEVLIAPFGCGGSGNTPVAKEQWLHDFHMACWRARCFDNGIFMIVAGGNGFPGPQHRTYACVIDPWAEVIASIDPEPDLRGLNMVVADLDPERFVSRRVDRDYPLKKRRPELYTEIADVY